MNGDTMDLCYSPSTLNTKQHCSINKIINGSLNDVKYKNKKKIYKDNNNNNIIDMIKKRLSNAYFVQWTTDDILGVVKYHPIPCIFGVSLFFFMVVEYTLRMVPSYSPPFDLGFIVTRPIHRLLASKPGLNTILAGLNTVFVGMQMVYIIWTFIIEGRPRATISALFMFTCRGILGYVTQLPLPEDFLGSGADFPVGNVSFFLFYSGHVAASVIASLDMKRMHRWKLAYLFDTLNVLQVIRLLSTRGHYTIDLAVGVGAGILFDSLAGNYVQNNNNAIDNSQMHENGEYLSVSSHENVH